MPAKRSASPAPSHGPRVKRTKTGLPKFTVRKEYQNIPFQDLDIAQLDDRFEEFGPAFNQHVFALAHAARLTPGYMAEQIRYINLSFNDLDTTTASHIEHSGEREFEIRRRNFCVKAVHSYGEIIAHAFTVPIKPDVLYYATKLTCAYMSMLVTKWGSEEDLNHHIPKFMTLFRNAIQFLEDNDPNKINMDLVTIPCLVATFAEVLAEPTEIKTNLATTPCPVPTFAEVPAEPNKIKTNLATLPCPVATFAEAPAKPNKIKTNLATLPCPVATPEEVPAEHPLFAMQFA
jgi:hypothetical protein